MDRARRLVSGLTSGVFFLAWGEHCLFRATNCIPHLEPPKYVRFVHREIKMYLWSIKDPLYKGLTQGHHHSSSTLLFFLHLFTMAPASTDAVQAALVAGHLHHLTPDQTSMLKKLWGRLFELFKQPGDPNSKPAEPRKVEAAPAKKGGFFSRGKKEPSEQPDLFIGATTDPNWLSQPLEKAIPLIPGEALKRSFWSMVGTDNPDAVMLRYLRARKWDFDAAYNMLINTLRWRLVMRIDDIIALGETGLRDELEKLKKGMGESFITNLHSGKAYLGGPDKSDRGIW